MKTDVRFRPGQPGAFPRRAFEQVIDVVAVTRRLVRRSPVLAATARRARRIERATRTWARRVTGRVPTVRIGEYSMKVPEDMYWAFTNGQYYERNVAFWIQRLLSLAAAPVLYDIGANYGYYTLLAARAAEHVYSFEPVTTTLRQLRENVSRNDLEGTVTVYPVGLSDHDGTFDINIYNSSGNNSLFAVESSNSSVRIVRAEPIQLVALDGLVDRDDLAVPTVVKIDIEGAELSALRGAVATLARSTPAIVMEFDEASFAAAGYSRADILAELDAFEYTVFGLATDPQDFTLHPRERLADHSIANVVAVPPRWVASVLELPDDDRSRGAAQP